MGRPAFVAEEDEQVLLDTGPHWLALAPRLRTPAVVVAAAVAGFVLWSSAPLWFGGVLLVALLMAFGIAAGRVLAWRATRFVVTTSRVVHRSGVLRRMGREIPITRVQDVTYRQGLLDRLAGIGKVRVESAGTGSAEEVADLPRPAEVQRAVNRALESALRGHQVPGRDDLAGQLERLDRLRRQGVVTDAEFARKKAELLARM